MIKNIAKRSISILAALAIIVSGVFIFAFDEAAAASKPGDIENISAKYKTYEATIKWSAADGPVKGYTIYRNGKVIKSVEASVRSYKDTELKASTNYTYYVKAYTFTGKKIRKWYNTETKKWQTKKPPKSKRGKSRLVKQKKYGNASEIIYFKTKKPVVIEGRIVKPSEFTKSNNYTISFTKKGTTCDACGEGQIVTVRYDRAAKKYPYTVSGYDNSKTCHNSSCVKNAP